MKRVAIFVGVNLLVLWALGRLRSVIPAYSWSLIIVTALVVFDIIVLRRARATGDIIPEKLRRFLLQHIFLITFGLVCLLTAFNSLVTVAIGQGQAIDLGQVAIGGGLSSIYLPFLLRRTWEKDTSGSR